MQIVSCMRTVTSAGRIFVLPLQTVYQAIFFVHPSVNSFCSEKKKLEMRFPPDKRGLDN